MCMSLMRGWNAVVLRLVATLGVLSNKIRTDLPCVGFKAKLFEVRHPWKMAQGINKTNLKT